MFSRPWTPKRKHRRSSGTATRRTSRYGRLARRPTGRRSAAGRAVLAVANLPRSLKRQRPPLQESVVGSNRALHGVHGALQGGRVFGRDLAGVDIRLQLVEESVQLV